MPWLDACSALVLSAAVLWVSWLAAIGLLPEARGGARWAAAATVGLWGLNACFEGLLAVGGFGRGVALPLVVLVALVAHLALSGRVKPIAALREEVEHLGALWREVPGRWRAALLLPLVALGPRTLRGLVAPPMAWDALTYHLYRAARWVQDGHEHRLPVPGAWDYYNHYPRAGDGYYAWILMVLPQGQALTPVGLGFILLSGLGLYAAARAAGAGRDTAGLGALTLLSLPAVASHVSACYVDVPVLATFCLGAVFTVRFVKRPTLGDALLAIAATSLAAAIKVSAGPALLVAAPLLALRVAIDAQFRRAGLRWALASAGVAAITLAPYVAMWRQTGSATYPFELRIGDLVSWRGHDEMTRLFKGQFLPFTEEPWKVWKVLLWTRLEAPPQYAAEMSFGLGALLLPFLAVLGTVSALRRGAARMPLVLFALNAALFFAGLMRPDMLGQRTDWALTLSRLLLPLLASLMVPATLLGGRGARLTWLFIAGVGVLQGLPLGGWGEADPWAMSSLAPLVVVGGVALVGLTRWAAAGAWRFALPALALVGVGGTVALGQLRDQWREPIWETMVPFGSAYDLHLLDQWGLSVLPIALTLDDQPPQRVAVAPGWGGWGQHNYLFLLMGRRMQHQLLYVPPTRDGQVIDLWRSAELEAAADPRAWLARLLDEGVSLVYLGVPAPLESTWVEARPEAFSLILKGARGYTALYQFHPEAAREELGLAAP